jgi:hypothetical protein
MPARGDSCHFITCVTAEAGGAPAEFWVPKSNGKVAQHCWVASRSKAVLDRQELKHGEAFAKKALEKHMILIELITSKQIKFEKYITINYKYIC